VADARRRQLTVIRHWPQGWIYSKRGPGSEKNVGEHIIYECPVTPPPDCLHPTLQGCVSITREHWTQWQSMTPARHTKSFPLFPNHHFNILACYHAAKNEKKLSFGRGPLLWGPCSAEHAEHACLNLPLTDRYPINPNFYTDNALFFPLNIFIYSFIRNRK